MSTQTGKTIDIDLTTIEMEEVKLFVQEGARGIPEMAASSAVPSSFPCISCAGACVAGNGE
jgi:hypothetical protein